MAQLLRLLLGCCVAEATLHPTALRVDYAQRPLAIDRPDPTFSWAVVAPEGQRGARTTGFTLTVTELRSGGGGRSWTRTASTNQ
eukprot:COSAG04_NODE_18330_length_445_cov_0.901734_1_plen_83_part_10